jgi:hypothetical protein
LALSVSFEKLQRSAKSTRFYGEVRQNFCVCCLSEPAKEVAGMAKFKSIALSLFKVWDQSLKLWQHWAWAPQWLVQQQLKVGLTKCVPR